jgi:predicted dehydrogenase
MEEYLRLLASKQLDIDSLIEAVYPIEEAEEAFEALEHPDRPLILLLDYGSEFPSDLDALHREETSFRFQVSSVATSGHRPIRVGLVGAGSFATSTHLPNLRSLDDFEIRAICSRTGSKVKAVADQFGANYATTDYQRLLSDEDIDLVLISTRHNLHGPMVLDALRSGKHTFVEKPLCLHRSELEQIRSFFQGITSTEGPRMTPPLLMVGFNRRFAPCIQEIKPHIQERVNPLFLHYRMNAGYVPLDHWVHDPEQGGGRIVGEACHIVDLFSFLVGAPVRAYTVTSLRPTTGSISSSDNKVISLEYEDGSVGTIHYFAVGPRELPKERLEVYWDEKSAIMEDYSSLKGWGVDLDWRRSWKGDKGHVQELRVVAEAMRSDTDMQWPISLESMVETTCITFAVR